MGSAQLAATDLSRVKPPAQAIIIEGEEEWEIETILDHKLDRRFKDPRFYLVKYLDYNETKWLQEADLDNCQELLDEFKSQHGI